MLSSKTDKHGRKIQARGNTSLSQDAVNLLKTQDAGYIRTVIQQTRRLRLKMEEEYLLVNGGSIKVLGGGHGAKGGQHLIFAETREEQESIGLAQAKRDLQPSVGDRLEQPDRIEDIEHGLNTSGQLHDDPRHIMLRKADCVQRLKQERAARKLRKRGNESRQSKLSALNAREKELLATEKQLGFQRARMSNSIGGVNKAGVKWKVRERKR